MTEYGIRSKENKYLIFLHYPLFKVQAPAELWIAQGVLLERLAHMGHQIPVPTFRMSLLTVKTSKMLGSVSEGAVDEECVAEAKWADAKQSNRSWRSDKIEYREMRKA